MSRQLIKRSETLRNPSQSGERHLLIEAEDEFAFVVEERHEGTHTVRQHIAHHHREDPDLVVGAYNRRLQQLVASGWRGPLGNHPPKLEGIELDQSPG